MTIPQILREFHDRFIVNERFYAVIGTAVNVDETKRNCDLEPLEDDATRVGI